MSVRATYGKSIYGKAIWQCHMARPYGIAIDGSRGRGCRAAAASRCKRDRKLFSGTLLWKNDLQKIVRIKKRTAQKNCTFSLLNHYKMIWFRSSYDQFCCGRKWFKTYVFYQSKWPRPGVSSRRNAPEGHEVLCFIDQNGR